MLAIYNKITGLSLCCLPTGLLAMYLTIGVTTYAIFGDQTPSNIAAAMEGNLAVAIQVKRRRNISVISVYIYMREIKLMITILNKYCYLHNSLNR